MNNTLAPEPILRAALRVVFVAAYTTRNWALNEDISRKQIYDLWEAIHEIPDLITRWRDDEECLRELHRQLAGEERKKRPMLSAVLPSFLQSPWTELSDTATSSFSAWIDRGRLELERADRSARDLLGKCHGTSYPLLIQVQRLSYAETIRRRHASFFRTGHWS